MGIFAEPFRAMIESPCNKICTLDAKSGVCLGCGRTGEEIGAWSAYSATQRRGIIKALPSRLEKLGLFQTAAARAGQTRSGAG